MSSGELLLEVRCEEIPARMLAPGVREIGSRLFEELLARHLAPEKVETGFTPRRLVVVRERIRVLAESGVAIIVISTDLDELVDMCDRGVGVDGFLRS